MFSFIFNKTKLFLVIVFISIQILGIYFITRGNYLRRDDLFLKATTPLALSIDHLGLNWIDPSLEYKKEIKTLLSELKNSSDFITNILFISNDSLNYNEYVFSSDTSIKLPNLIYSHIREFKSQIVNQNLIYHRINNGYVVLEHKDFKFKSLEDIDNFSVIFLLFTLTGLLSCLLFIFKLSEKGKPLLILSIFLLNISLFTLYGYDHFLHGRLNVLDKLAINGEIISNIINDNVKKEIEYSNELLPSKKYKTERNLSYTKATKLPLLIKNSKIIKPVFSGTTLIGFKEAIIQWEKKNNLIPKHHAKDLSLEIQINDKIIFEHHSQHKFEPYFVDIPIIIYGRILNFKYYSTLENLNRNVTVDTILLLVLIISLVIIVFILTIFISSKHSGLKKEVKEKESVLQSFMSSASEGFTTWDKNNKLTYINDAQKNIYRSCGLKIPQLGSDILLSAPNLTRNKRFKEFLNSTDISEYLKDDFKVSLADKVIYLSINAFRISDGFGLIASNITEKIEKEKKLKEMAIKANESSRAKSEFLSNISHELRTPLNGISGLSDILLDSPLPKEEKNYIKTIKECGESLIKTVNDILDFSRYQSDELKISEGIISIRKIFNTMFLKFQKTLGDKKIGFEVNIDPQIPDELIGDNLKIEKVLYNIIDNAIKFSNEGEILCNVKITNYSDSKIDLIFYIKDTGIGIPTHKLEDIFEVFYQVDSSLTREYSGTGLGLSTCKKLINLMAGDIGVTSTLGKGSTVWFSLSLDYSSTKVKPENNLKILVVDDNKVNIMVAENILKKMGHCVYSTINGKEAIDSIKKNNFDLVFMDIQMPVMDGIEATIAVRNGLSGNKKKNIPIAAMTANTSPEINNRYIQSGMNGIISKPISASSISKLINEIF